MIRPPTPHVPVCRLAAVSATLALACAFAQPPPADAQTQGGRDDRIPSELWRTYPLDPSNGAATIETEEPDRPPSAPVEPARPPSAPVERPSEGSSEERQDGAAEGSRGSAGSGSRAGVAVTVAIAVLGILASLFVLRRFPAPTEAGTMSPGIPEWLETARRRARDATRSTQSGMRRTAAWDGFRSFGRKLHHARADLGHWAAQRRTKPLFSSRRPSIEPIPAADDPPRAPVAAPRTQGQEAAPAATTSRAAGGQARAQDVDKLKTKARAQSESDEKRIAEADTATLKRKLTPPPPERDVLKAKKRHLGEPQKDPPTARKPDRGDESHAEPAHPDPAAQLPRPTAAESRSRRGLALRPVAEPRAPAPVRIVPVERPPECTIVWWRGYVKSRFLAIGEAEPGDDPVIAASPFFRWRSAEPPPETPAIAQALQALVRSLELRGWAACGRGTRWFSVRMQLTFGEEPVQERHAERPETGQKGSM